MRFWGNPQVKQVATGGLAMPTDSKLFSNGESRSKMVWLEPRPSGPEAGGSSCQVIRAEGPRHDRPPDRDVAESDNRSHLL